MLKKIFFLICFFFCIPFSAFAGFPNNWIYDNPYPTGATLIGVKFATPQKGWIVGMQNLILYTDDGGETWTEQESGTHTGFNDIFMCDENTGWIVGRKGTILYTNNGGKIWASQTTEYMKYSFYRCFFVNSQDGWLLGEGNDESIILLHTTDGGNSWQEEPLPEQGLKITKIFFLDKKTGWFATENKVYRTTDGGEKWDQSALPIVKKPGILSPNGQAALHRFNGGWLGDIYFVNKNEGWAVVGDACIFHTEDGGKTWSSNSDRGDYMLWGLAFAPNGRGCAYGTSVFCTEDGKSWNERLGLAPSRRRIGEFIININTGSFTDNKTGWVVGSDGLIMKTEDAGTEWKIKSRTTQITFIDNETGWGVDRYTNTIYRTSDGGITLTPQTVIKDLLYRDILVLSPKEAVTVWLKRDKEETTFTLCTVSTSNGGATWITNHSEKVLKNENFPNRFYFVNSNYGWCAGKNGIILHTEDAGKHWKQQNSGTNLHLHGIHFIDKKHGWIIGDSGHRGWLNPNDPKPQGVILYTENGGQSWKVQWSKQSIPKVVDAGVWLNSVYFLDKNRGWVTGDSGLLLSTEDGGGTWSAKKIYNGPGELFVCNFIDAKPGWIGIIDEEGRSTKRYLITEDGGQTWITKKFKAKKCAWQPIREKGETIEFKTDKNH